MATAQAEVGAQYLIHYPTGQFAAGDLLSEARTQFEDPVTLAEDFVSFIGLTQDRNIDE
ncbi:MAG: hypothetical protein IMZ50_17705 [Candidatus Atribacteria bacterium]|nr:hypothetical protein [Candidatus Atribacteria bacterium]